MQFSLSSLLVALAVVSSAAATPASGAKRGTATSDGECNGTSCQVGFDNFECNKGSCTGPGGGDGAYCTVVDRQDGTRVTYCPGCGDPNFC
ncbi:hypothetical protein F4677DRAFT_443638 [Hypoxylon crocopeplum]|nr:hypothetical protein F4677DRAFT_443638 [Hypoxylon crocopeplum]